jgi:hypothetical protein
MVQSRRDLASTCMLRPPSRLVPNFRDRRSEVEIVVKNIEKNIKKNTSFNLIYELAKVIGVIRIYTVGNE